MTAVTPTVTPHTNQSRPARFRSTMRSRNPHGHHEPAPQPEAPSLKRGREGERDPQQLELFDPLNDGLTFGQWVNQLRTQNLHGGGPA